MKRRDPRFDPTFWARVGSNFREAPRGLSCDDPTDPTLKLNKSGRNETPPPHLVGSEIARNKVGSVGSRAEPRETTAEFGDPRVGSTWDQGGIATLALPIRTKNPLNLREHWAARHRRAAAHRKAIADFWPWKRRAWRFPVVVELQRIHPARARDMDDDGLSASFKAIRDEVAKQLGVDDGRKDLVRFVYPPELVGPWGIRITITERPGALTVPEGR